MALIPVGIALGSNQGNREAELDAAVTFLRTLAAGNTLVESPRLQTEPLDCPPGSPPFLNSVVELPIDPDHLPPVELLRRLQLYEQSRGRPREHGTNTPRPIDLDILYYGGQIIHEPGLIVPHPRAAERRFVLEPLSHLRPNLVLPGQTATIRELLLRLDG